MSTSEFIEEVIQVDEAEPTEAEVKTRADKSNDQFLLADRVARVREELGGSKREYTFPVDAIHELPRSQHLLLGFDTEYQSLSEFFTKDDVAAKKAKYEVLSYQFHAINHLGAEWDGIAIPDENKRLTFSDFITWVIAKGVALGHEIPKTIVLVGHYTRADIPAFDDRRKLQPHLSNIRNSLVSRGLPIKVRYLIDGKEDHFVEVSVYVRDTILLAPAGRKSLAELGKLIGIEKMVLSEDETINKTLKKSMKTVRSMDWPLFRQYAIHDAKISAKYYQVLTKKVVELTGGFAPTALSSIGMTLLIKSWKDAGLDPVDVVGRTHWEEETYDERNRAFRTIKTKPYREELHWFAGFATECYHGGRNEQLWFGPSFEDDWLDVDLSGAYPTAMAMNGRARWDEAKAVRSFEEVQEPALTLVCVDFEFPATVRYPTLPVRTQNGLVFPLRGRSCCAMPEIELARQLGCKMTLRFGVSVPVNEEEKIFQSFIAQAIHERAAADSPLEKAFWKEVANSCYGKTAQGLHDKRVFNLRKKKSDRVPESAITNPFYAAQITSMVRAVVGEIMNRIPQEKMVFSVTTDGFITNATDEEMAYAKAGPLSKAFSKSRLAISGDPEVLTQKHAVRQLVGWRTRGQATLKPGLGEENTIVLARAGIKPPVECTELAEQNDYVVDLFFGRSPESKISIDVHTSIKELFFDDADLVNKRIERQLSMEFDLKRKPKAVATALVDLADGSVRQHVSFSTMPWDSIENFQKARKFWNAQWKSTHRNIKTFEDFESYAGFFDMMVSLPKGALTHLKKDKGDLKRFQRDLCRAFKHREAGMDAYQGLTAQEFARELNGAGFEAMGVRTTRATVENGKRIAFKPNQTPRSQNVLDLVARVRDRFPLIQIDRILSDVDIPESLSPSLAAQCVFIDRLRKPEFEEYDRDAASSVDFF